MLITPYVTVGDEKAMMREWRHEFIPYYPEFLNWLL